MRRSSERDAFLSAARRARTAGIHGPSLVSPTFERTGHSGSGRAEFLANPYAQGT